jgi:7tm Chemosensory receptor
MIETTVRCKSSQKMIDVTEKLCQQTEGMMISTSITQEDLQSVKVILNMRKKIRFTALGYFSLKSATILSLVSYVGSYAVILIQTR